MEMITKQLNNGVNLKIIKTNKFKLVNLQVSFMTNLEYEEIAPYNLLVNILTTRNSKYKSMDKFSAYLENNYGMSFSGNYYNRGNVAITSFVNSVINSKYSLGENLLQIQVKTIQDCLFHPLLNEESLQEIKMLYIQRLKEKLNNKSYILQKKVNELFDNNTPYGVNIESDIDSINKVSLKEIEGVYHKLLTSDCNVYVCGEVDENEVSAYFSELNLTNSQAPLLNIDYLKKIKNYDKQVFESSFLQSAIELVYECDINYNDKLYYPLKLFIEMLNYDLFNVIREKYNFCYYIYALSNNYLNTINIISEIEYKNLDKVVELANEIIKSYDTNFNLERFELCKNKILTYIKTSLDSPRDIIDLQFGFDFTKTNESIKDLENSYIKITSDEVKRVSKMVTLKLVSILKEANKNG